MTQARPVRGQQPYYEVLGPDGGPAALRGVHAAATRGRDAPGPDFAESAGAVRIAVVTESFLPHINGVTGSVVQVLRHLRRRRHAAMVWAPGGPPAHVEGAPVVALPSLPLPGYPQVRVPLTSAGTLVKELERFRPDVVHLASPFAIGAPAMRAATRLKVPVVAIYQTDVAGFAERYGLGMAQELIWHRLRSIHDRADLTLAPSVTVREDLHRQRIPRVQLWARGVDPTVFSPAWRDNHRRLALVDQPGDVLVGYIGRLADEKHVDDLRVLNDLRGVRLVVIGDGPRRADLQRILPRAAFLGLLTGPDLSRAVASLDIAVQPGPYETFCQAAQEAMASGVPVVAVGAGATAELIDPSRTGWVYPRGDLAQLRAHVQDLAGDDAKRRAMGLAARAAVRTRTWPAVCDQLLTYYQSVVQGSPITTISSP